MHWGAHFWELTLPLFSLPTANTAINVTLANTYVYAPVHAQVPGQQAGGRGHAAF